MTAAETLRAARELIADKERWCTGDFARDKDGDAVAVGRAHSTRAVSFCALGAMYHLGVDSGSPAMRCLVLAADDDFNETVAGVNDLFGHEAVLKMYDIAIKMAESGDA